MKRATAPFIYILLWMTHACGGDARNSCQIAQQRVDQCDAEIIAMGHDRGLPLLEFSGECSGWSACDAACVNKASCAAMSLALFGGGSDPNRPPVPDAGPFLQCLMDCEARFETQ